MFRNPFSGRMGEDEFFPEDDDYDEDEEETDEYDDLEDDE